MLAFKGIATMRVENEHGGFEYRHVDLPYDTVKNTIITLPKDVKYHFGIDQSSSCIGFCFRDADRDFTVQFDCHSDKIESDNVFFKAVRNLLERTVEGIEIEWYAAEAVPPKKGYTARLLQELHGRLEEWKDYIPELRRCKYFDSFLPQTWRSKIPNGSGVGTRERNNSKRLMAEDLARLDPGLTSYVNNYPFSDFDSFDANGIVRASEILAFTPDGRRKIFANPEKKHVSLVGMKIIPLEKLVADPASLLNWLPEQVLKELKPEIQIYNEQKPLYNNIRMASTWAQDRCVVTYLPFEFYDQYRWKMKRDLSPERDVVVMFIVNPAKCIGGVRKFFDYKFDYTEERRGDE